MNIQTVGQLAREGNVMRPFRLTLWYRPGPDKGGAPVKIDSAEVHGFTGFGAASQWAMILGLEREAWFDTGNGPTRFVIRNESAE